MTRRWEDSSLALIGAAPVADPETERLAAIVRRRARDPEDAELLLDALGLNGDARPAAHVNTARYAHGARSGVEHHLELDQLPCRACQRWLDVQERKGPQEQWCGDAVGTPQGYWRHKARRRPQPACAACREAYRVWRREQTAAKGAGRGYPR